MAYVKNGDANIFYRVCGEGVPMVLIMGLGGTSDAWHQQIPVFSKQYQLILIDNRGAGRSDKPNTPYSMALFVSDIKTVLDHLEIDQAHVIGLSMGGMIAQEFALTYPLQTLSLIIGCSGVGKPDPEYVYPEQNVLEILEMERDSDKRSVVEKMVEIFYHPLYRQKIPDLVDKIIHLQSLMPQPNYAYKRQLAACSLSQMNSPRLKTLQVPTLVLHGAEDLVWPLQNAYNLAKLIPGAKCHVIEEAGHMFFLEKPDEFNHQVLQFLGGL